LDIDPKSHLTPIPVDDDLSSLSTILLNDEYYHYMLDHSKLENGRHRANTEAFFRKIEFPFTIGYGMTKCGPLISYEHFTGFRQSSEE
jgi:hypothetical protein